MGTSKEAADKDGQESLGDEFRSKCVNQPETRAAFIIKSYTSGFGIEPTQFGLIADLQKQNELASKGDLSRPEAMLMAQSHTLDAVFSDQLRLAKQAASKGASLETIEKLMKLGLKAQSQCARTLEVLREFKNPTRVAMFNQTNIANGHQQVNNSGFSGVENTQIELLEGENGQWMDGRATRSTIRSDTEVAAMEAIDGSENIRGQGGQQ